MDLYQYFFPYEGVKPVKTSGPHWQRKYTLSQTASFIELQNNAEKDGKVI